MLNVCCCPSRCCHIQAFENEQLVNTVQGVIHDIAQSPETLSRYSHRLFTFKTKLCFVFLFSVFVFFAASLLPMLRGQEEIFIICFFVQSRRIAGEGNGRTGKRCGSSMLPGEVVGESVLTKRYIYGICCPHLLYYTLWLYVRAHSVLSSKLSTMC